MILKFSKDNNKFKARKHLNPSQILVFSFLFFILFGTVLLKLPISTVDHQGMKLIDALFTSTSAVCLTGLSVVELGTYFSSFGKIVIMLLVQIGGLGFMTLATMMALIIGKRISLRERLLLQEALNQSSLEGLVKLVKYIIIMTITFEFSAAVVLFMRFYFLYGDAKQALFLGVFHAISAFNNAGFDIMGEGRSLQMFTDDIVVNVVLASLIVLGGLGFVVINDLYKKKCNFKKLSLHSKVVLFTSTILIISGILIFFVLEFSNPNTLAGFTWKEKFLSSFFQGITPRTAGLSTVDIGELRMATQFLIMIMMFIGASPGSAGGGIKVTTFAIAVTTIVSILKGREDNFLFERTINYELVKKSFAIISMSLLLITSGILILTITENQDFLALAFEVTSAFSTGLSMGITSELSRLGRLVIIVVMFAGRIGPLTLVFALSHKSHKAKIKYPNENIMIG